MLFSWHPITLACITKLFTAVGSHECFDESKQAHLGCQDVGTQQAEVFVTGLESHLLIDDFYR